MTESERIALIELGGSHDECLLSQLVALKTSGRRTLLICNREIMDRHPEFEDFVDEQLIIAPEELKKRRFLRKMVARKLKRSKPAMVVFNTVQGSLVRDLSLRFLFSSIKFSGIVHTTRKLRGSFTQKIIGLKVKRYLLLSEHLLESVGGKRKGLDYFYPLRFPEFVERVEEVPVPTIAIIGGVERRRKDLDGFMEMLGQLDKGMVRFVFLGKSDPEKEEVQHFKRLLNRSELSADVVLYDHFVDQREFDSVVKSAALILPLVHPDTPSADEYFRNQIPGAMMVSFAYKVPMLVHGAYRHIEEMHKAAFYYQPDAFRVALLYALEKRASKVGGMKQEQKFDLLYQEERYLNFLFNSAKNN